MLAARALLPAGVLLAVCSDSRGQVGPGASLLQRRVVAASRSTVLQRRAHKAGHKAGHRHRRHARQVYRQEMKNVHDLQYTSDVTVGQQTLNGIIDTGSFEVLVFSARCQSCGSSGKYDSASSDSYTLGQLVTTQAFGSGVLKGQEAFESIKMGPMTAKNTSFWEVMQAQMPVLQAGSFQAIVGVGPSDSARKIAKNQAVAAANLTRVMKEKDFPDVIKARANVVANEAEKAAALTARKLSFTETLGVHDFSICLGRDVGSSGFFIWNDDSRSKSARLFSTIPVIGEVHWGVEMKGAALQGDKRNGSVPLGCSPTCGAVVDSGTSLIAAPTKVLASVDAMLAALDRDCSRIGEMPDLVFTLGGHEFRLPPQAYIGEVTADRVIGDLPLPVKSMMGGLLPHASAVLSGNVCMSLLMPMDKQTQFGPMWILGVPFFREFYTTFSLKGGLPGQPTRKTLYVAPATKDCHPGTRAALLGTRSSARQRVARKVPLSHLAEALTPRWLRETEDTLHI